MDWNDLTDEEKEEKRIFHRMRLSALHNGNLIDREFDYIFGSRMGPIDFNFTEEPYRASHLESGKVSVNGHVVRRIHGQSGDVLSRKRRRLTKRKFLRKIRWAK